MGTAIGIRHYHVIDATPTTPHHGHTGRTLRELVVPDPRAATVVASTGFALEPWTETVCVHLSWDGTFRVCSLGGKAEEGPLVMEAKLSDPRGANAADKRYVLARRWEGEDDCWARRRRRPGDTWPPLWCGDRRTGRVSSVHLKRAHDVAE